MFIKVFYIGYSLITLASGLVFENQKQEWLYSRQCDAWLAKMNTYITVEERISFCSKYPLDFSFNYFNISFSNIKETFGNRLNEAFNYFNDGFGIQLPFLNNVTETYDQNEDEDNHLVQDYSNESDTNKKSTVINRVRSRSQPRRLSKQDINNGNSTNYVYWPNDKDKWAIITFESSGLFTPLYSLMPTNETTKYYDTLIKLRFLKGDVFRYGGRYLCDTLLRDEITKNVPYIPPYSYFKPDNGNIWAKENDTIIFGALYQVLKNQQIGYFTSQIPEKPDYNTMLYPSIRNLAIYSPFKDKSFAPQLGQISQSINIRILQDTKKECADGINLYMYSRVGNIYSNPTPGMILSTQDFSPDYYPSKNIPYNETSPLLPLVELNKECLYFLSELEPQNYTISQ